MRDTFVTERAAMVTFLKEQGITNKKVLAAMKKVPREDFIPQEQQLYAYRDTALPLGYSATISQPLVIATILEALELKRGQRVLEIGSGSGYVLALLKEMVSHKGFVVGCEIIPELVESSQSTLSSLGYDALILGGTGREGNKTYGPYHRIVISCACQTIPEILFSQLTADGILIAPVGTYFQVLVKYKRKNNAWFKEHLGFVRFVPLR